MTYPILSTVTTLPRRLAVLTTLLAGLSIGPAVAGDVAEFHSSWRDCLDRSFGFQVALTSRTLAADTALRACRHGEDAYLDALSTSPLVDGDDVARVRPALLQRARGWLLGGRASRPL